MNYGVKRYNLVRCYLKASINTRIPGVHNRLSAYHHHCASEEEAIQNHWSWIFYPNKQIFEIPKELQSQTLCPGLYWKQSTQWRIDIATRLHEMKQKRPFGQLIINSYCREVEYGIIFYRCFYKSDF